MEFYRNEIQLDIKVINDIFKNFNKDTKMLVFGLGYDSKMWFNGNKNTYFVENNDAYIKLNEKDIPLDNIIKYDYKNITVDTSFSLNDETISNYTIPNKLLELAPFDIILIDGPEGWRSVNPGRLIPCYWSSQLSKNGSLIYLDDSSRKLESYCINKYFKKKERHIFPERSECTKIFF